MITYGGSNVDYVHEKRSIKKHKKICKSSEQSLVSGYQIWLNKSIGIWTESWKIITNSHQTDKRDRTILKRGILPEHRHKS